MICKTRKNAYQVVLKKKRLINTDLHFKPSRPNPGRREKN